MRWPRRSPQRSTMIDDRDFRRAGAADAACELGVAFEDGAAIAAAEGMVMDAT